MCIRTFWLLTYEYLHVCGTRSGGGIGISSPSIKGLLGKVEQRGGKFDFFFTLTGKAFANMSSCHLDKTKSHVLYQATYLKAWKHQECDCGGDKVPHCSTAGLTVLPCWQQPNVKLGTVFLHFAEVELNGPLLDFFYLVSLQLFLFFLKNPILRSISSRSISPVIWVIFCICLRLHLNLSAWGVGVWAEAVGAESKRKRGQGLHFVILLFCILKACSLAWLPCEPLCEGARHRSAGCQTLFPFFSVVASHEERYSREEEGFQFALEQCLCLYNCAYLLWEQPCPRALNFNMSSFT